MRQGSPPVDNVIEFPGKKRTQEKPKFSQEHMDVMTDMDFLGKLIRLPEGTLELYVAGPDQRKRRVWIITEFERDGGE